MWKLCAGCSDAIYRFPATHPVDSLDLEATLVYTEQNTSTSAFHPPNPKTHRKPPKTPYPKSSQNKSYHGPPNILHHNNLIHNLAIRRPPINPPPPPTQRNSLGKKHPPGSRGGGKENFRMKYARADWDAERASWRAVIQLNVIRSIITIVEALQAEMDGEPEGEGDLQHPVSPGGVSSAGGGGGGGGGGEASGSGVVVGGTGREGSKQLSTLLTGKHQVLKMRLGPLRRVETDLKRRLGAGSDEDMGLPLPSPAPAAAAAAATGDGAATNVLGGANLGPLSLETDSQGLARPLGAASAQREFGVTRLQEALQRGQRLVRKGSAQSVRRQGRVGSGRATPVGEDGEEEGEMVDDATEILASCLEDMKALWTDDVVRAVLKKRRIRIEDTAGFFLDDLDRIAQRDYSPSDDDVVRARLRTLGVQEYRIRLDDGPTSIFAGGIGGDAGKEWILYDVGGSRTVRHAWLPYFDNVQAIIFLAPVSCFDERLTEDARVNRLEDSFLLWRTVCSSKLLASTTMILFLNKCDLLKRKLKAGVQVRKYLPSYGERANDVNTVVKCALAMSLCFGVSLMCLEDLREKFKEQLKEHSPTQRASYFYATSVVDTKATATTIKAVKDSILRDYLKNADFLS
ncbi:Guanine nucleotide-binding protein alpha-4 subunit [Psilocybe cubensis]|uniref:Guanine nucleotide-binding protein alpha-4 subunit n=1 Tax=Psilocybe cubensis TaxID=181762 RepID=A0ACB8GTM6_PSICU|nr:Guanine nucleotide-binding protein alpha-4 subunit [Psilocybe cubensis]KAH9479016.1 Guanine nucleotide-binding protein alpha-4 subunit [Psilocybe cubensis]